MHHLHIQNDYSYFFQGLSSSLDFFVPSFVKILFTSRLKNGLAVASARILQKSNGQNHTPQGNHGRTVHPPHSSMNGRHTERLPRRNLLHQQTQRTCLVAAQRSSAARGLRLVTLLLWHRVFALYEVGYGNTPSISQMSVLEIEPHMDRISLGIGVNEQRGGEAVDLSNR
jgi:hypothetical protein